jgi:acyl dehydratase
MTAITEHPGWPSVGVELGPEPILVDEERVQRYLACVNDTAFDHHANSMAELFGFPVAPATVLDGELGSLIFRKRYGILGDSLHAGQGFRFHRPLRVGCEYEMSAQVEDIYERRGIEYVVVRGWCRDDDGVCITQHYLKALHVPKDREDTGGSPLTMTIADFIERHGGRRDAVFPSVGAVVSGGERLIDERISREFSRVKDTDRPGMENIHTDPEVAKARGFGHPIVKGLLATVSEAVLYRELFGAEWYTRGRLSTKYVRPIPVGVSLTAVGIVVESSDARILLRSAVAGDGTVVAVGEAGIE